jgi:hypothetical protein
MGWIALKRAPTWICVLTIAFLCSAAKAAIFRLLAARLKPCPPDAVAEASKGILAAPSSIRAGLPLAGVRNLRD